MIHYRSYPVCITYTSVLTMGNPSRRPRQVILPIRRWCTTISTRLPKSMNQLWTTYLFTKNPCLVSSMQLLMYPSHVQCKRYGLNAQINVNTPKKIGRGSLSPTLLHHVLLLRAQSQQIRQSCL